MDQGTHRTLIGQRDRLAFEIARAEAPDPGLYGLGWSELTLWIGGRRYWFGEEGSNGPRGIAWTWLELVEHLALAWPYLRYEETAPFGIVAEDLEGLRDPQRLRALPGHDLADLEEAILAFQHRHDLAAGLEGLWLPSLWLLREGNTVRALPARGETDYRGTQLPLAEAFTLLEKLAQTLLDPSSAKGIESAHLREARALWQRRNRVDPAQALRLRTALSWDELEQWTPPGYDPLRWWGDPTRLSDTPLCAAARLSAPLSPATRHRIVEAVAGLPTTSARATSDVLQQLSEQARSALESWETKLPYEQGYALAGWLRERLELADRPFDPQGFLQEAGVAVGTLPEGLDPALDAVACWGGSLAPTVLLNPQGQHAHAEAGRRATLAHEIAHLLVDRDTTLPILEVLGGAVPTHVEQRARAFAAELLLPRHVVADWIAQHGFENGGRQARERYGVSRELFAWQVRNGPARWRLSPSEQRILERWCRREPGAIHP